MSKACYFSTVFSGLIKVLSMLCIDSHYATVYPCFVMIERRTHGKSRKDCPAIVKDAIVPNSFLYCRRLPALLKRLIISLITYKT